LISHGKGPQTTEFGVFEVWLRGVFYKKIFIFKRFVERGDNKMGIKNKTQKTVIANKYRLCRSVASKAKGLMFTNRSTVIDRALIFEFGRPALQSLHMFFVFYKIDVLFLDEKKKVVDIKERFRPFTVYNSSQRSKYVIEIPESAVQKSRTRIGDVIEWR
jgi:uncharacterized membrane protein (UPF0127 family)